MDPLDIYKDTVKMLGVNVKLWKEYSRKDPEFVKRIFRNVNVHQMEIFSKAVNELDACGITVLNDLFDGPTVEYMLEDYNVLLSQKPKSHHVSFDGNNGENTLEKSIILSEVVTNSTIRNIVEACLGQPVNMAYEKLYTDISMKGYSDRAYRPHHDGHGHTEIKAMILLSDVEEGTLGMRFCCGTHKYIYPTTRSQETQIKYEYWDKLKHIDCHGKAGTVFIFNANAIHSGWKDIIDYAKRSVLVINFQPGQMRNYSVSRLHSIVLESMSSYERYAYKVINTFDFADDDTDDMCLTKITQSRILRKKIYSSFDTAITSFVGSKQNLYEISKYNIDIMKMEPPIFENIGSSKKELEKVIHNICDVSKVAIKYKVQVCIDDIIDIMHKGLDLPIRMYGVQKDYLRDNAIIKLRDSSMAKKIKLWIAGHIWIFGENINSIVCQPPNISKMIDDLSKKMSSNKLDINEKQLCDDLIVMLSRPDNNIEYLVRTMMWSIVIISKNCVIDVSEYLHFIFFYSLWSYL